MYTVRRIPALILIPNRFQRTAVFRHSAISRSDTIPAMDIRTKDANVGHEAQIGSISDEAVFYLMSRGMSEEDARACIVSGFADNVSKELPLEYAVEMNNLIRLEMKGSIG